MSNPSVWSSVMDLATILKDSANVDRSRDGMPTSRANRQDPVVAFMDRVSAMTSRGRRLLTLAETTEMLQSQTMLGSRPKGLAEWLRSLRSIEAAHRLGIEWVRSQMPLYPLMPAPQLAPGTPWTTVEFSWQIVWQPNSRAARLQYLDLPPAEVPAAYGLIASGPGRECREAYRGVARALKTSREWEVLSSLSRSLTEEVRTELKSAKGKIKSQLAAEYVNLYEPSLALGRDEFRQATVDAIISDLSQLAQEYCFAFAAADDLLTWVLSDILGQLIYEPVLNIGGILELSGTKAGGEYYSFVMDNQIADFPFARIVHVDHALMRDALFVTGYDVSFRGATEVMRLNARRLSGSAASWTFLAGGI